LSPLPLFHAEWMTPLESVAQGVADMLRQVALPCKEAG
jgi:hypothetical protein